jgi:SOS-response transcriptional repressor LexA
MGETKFDILAAVVDHRQVNNFGPTVEELRQQVGLTRRSSVQWHINHLMEDGLLENVPRKHRTLRPTDRGKRLVEVLREVAHGDLANKGV